MLVCHGFVIVRFFIIPQIVSFRKPVRYARVAVAKTLAKKVKLYKKKKYEFLFAVKR